MATGNLVKDFSDEATCSLCLEHFEDPVTIDCGHNFCQACITQCVEKIGPSCPQCRQPISPRNVKPNRPLANLVELIKKLEQEKREKENKGVCWKHQEPLRLFCKEDQMLICMVCHISKEHKDHNIFPLDTTHDAASQEYKGKIKNQIPLLEQKRRELEALRLDEEQKSQILLILLNKERQNGFSAFEKLQKTLEENKNTWICCLDGLEKKMKKNREENAAELLNQITDLSSLIAEMEKCQQPAGEFLQVTADHLDTCKRTEDRNLVFKSCQELESSLTVFTYKRKVLGKMFKEFQDSLEKTLQDGDMAQQSLKEALQMGKIARGNINKLLTQSSSVMPHPGGLDAPYVNTRSETGPTPEPGMGWLRRQLPGIDSHECGPLAEMHTSWSPGELMTLSKQFPPVCEDPIKFQNLLGTIMRVYKPSREDVDLLLQELMPQRLLKTLRKRAKWPVPGQREPQDWDLAQARGDLVEAVSTFCASGVDWCKINTCKQKKGEDPADYMQRLTQIFEKHSGITGGVNTAPQAVVSIFVNGLLPEVSKQLKLNCIGWEGKKLDAVLAAAKHFYRQLKKKQEKLPGQQGRGDRIMDGRRMALGPMPGPPRPAGGCFLCGELSHWKRECPYQAKYRPWAFQGPQRQPGWAARQQAREFSPPPPQFLGSGPPGRRGTQQNEMVQGYPYLEQAY